MENPFKSIYKFNKEAGLLEAGYNHLREPAFLIEEALEGLDNLECLVERLKDPEDDTKPDKNPKDVSRFIVNLAKTSDNIPSDLEIFDKHIDAFVYTVGSMAKLGLSPQQIEAGIAAVMHSNMQKLKNKKYDEHGKLLKDENFIGPEEALQKILNKRQL